MRSGSKIADKRLLQPCEKVTDFGSGTQKVIRNLKDTLQNAKNPEGAGLAAPQIGVLKRITIVRNYVFNPADKETPIVQEFVLINPKIISQSKDTIVEYEGCLSVPNSYGKVERNKKVKIKAQDESGETIRGCPVKNTGPAIDFLQYFQRVSTSRSMLLPS